jgi:RHS repeat-associated protein
MARQSGFAFSSYLYHAVCVLVVGAATVYGQQGFEPLPGASITDETAKPTPGAGHDYMTFFGETVSPSNGSVSFKIQYPMPRGRGISLPHYYTYSSAGIFHFGQDFYGKELFLPTGNSSAPLQASWSEWIFTPPQAPPPAPPLVQCNFATGFTFTDMSGQTHGLHLGVVAKHNDGQPTTVCAAGQTAIPSGTDGEVWARFVSPSDVITAVGNWTTCASCDPPVNIGPLGKFTVTDSSGVTYFYAGDCSYDSNDKVCHDTPYKIEDRNGNQITWMSGGYVDSLGRQVVNGNSIGGISYPAPVLGNPGPSTTNYTPQNQHTVSTAWGEVLACPITAFGSNMLINTSSGTFGIALPTSTQANPQQYTFFAGAYNPNDTTLQNSYGLINEIVYPGGGWIKYKWNVATSGQESDYSEMATLNGNGLTSHQSHPGCFVRYSTPKLIWRQVSYDGVNPAQTQVFTYSTNWGGGNWVSSPTDWSSKTTTVQTTDNLTGKKSFVVYTYGSAMSPGGGQPMSSGGVAAQIPVEHIVQYYDGADTNAPLLRTVTKSWYDTNSLQEEDVTENGKTKKTTYCYFLAAGGNNCQPGFPIHLSEVDNYDYGATSPTRKTKYQYSTFSDTTVGPAENVGLPVPSLPSVIKVTDGSDNVLSETDYSYDETSLASVSALNHDDTAYPSSFVARGNLTTKVQKCFGCANATATTKYAYDMAGQIKSVIDPCGNTACGDMTGTNHTTTFSYSDSFGGGNPDAYLTQITYPTINSVTQHESFTYNYTLGDVLSSTDPNGLTTNYHYVDPLDRLTETDFPNGGKTTVSYNDLLFSPTATTQQWITTAMPPKTTVGTADGMFHGVKSQLTSDPEGPDATDTTYDGMGHVWKVSNPYRGSQTDGVSETQYDALGRVVKVIKQDGSSVVSAYGGTCAALTNVFPTTATDESGHVRRSCTDGLGRLVEVDEPGTASGSPATPASGNFTITGAEQSVITGPPTAGTGSVTISGTEQSWQTQTSPATSSSGSVTITGSLQSKQVQTQSATSGSGSASIVFTGSNVSRTIDPCYPHGSCPQPANNFGTLSVTVNGTTFTVNYDQTSNVATLAPALGSAMNGTLLNASGGTSGAIGFSAKATGASTNYNFSTSTTWYSGTCPDGNPCFGAAPFYFAPASGAMSGGHDAVNTTVYDHGTTTITINGQPISYSWSGSGTNTASIAVGLASAINSSSSYATATVSGATITLTSRTTGASVNYSLSSSSTFDSGNFSSASFGTSNSGGSMTGGADAQFTTNWDSGTTTITVNGHGTPYNWSGSSTTSTTIASGMASAINADGSASVNASASGSTINLTSRTTGASTNYSLSASTSQQHGSFSSNASGGALTGGSAGAVQYDSGTASVTVGAFTANVTYGQGSTANSVASALASAFAGSGITATASGPTVTLTTTQTGAAQNLPVSDTYATSQPGAFGGSSFQLSVSGPTLTGGSDAGNPTMSSPAVTLYGYDALDRLTCVVQKNTDATAFTPTLSSCPTAPATWRPRWFTYDSLSRLLTATNPESGTLTYTYDANGNVATRKDARNVTTTYLYDNLNRLIQKSYNDTPRTATVKYLYDGLSTIGSVSCTPTLTPANPKGKRTSMCDAAGSESWSYPLVAGTGWQTVDKRTTNGVTKTITTQSNLDGSVASITYPSGRVITYTPGGAGRPLEAKDNGNSINYVTNATYAAFGGLTGLKNGSSITVSNGYDPRQQPTFLSATAPTGAILSVSYDFHLGNSDNGNVYKIINGRDGNRTQNFTYDALNRIAEAWTSGPNWGEGFTIDPWGNLTNRNPIPGKNNYESLSAAPADHNRLSGFGYDAAGNMISNGSASYTYDAESRLLTAGGVTYTYDGDGNRVKKSNGTLYWGAGPLAESDLTASSTSWKEYVFFGGARVARRDASNSSVHYFFSNHLGSTSVITNNTGASFEEDVDYFPYGGLASGTSSDHYLFNGKERDSESGLDNFGARFDASSLGRFMIPDWAEKPTDVPYAHFGNPQSLNLYSYVQNNPTTFTDPDGHICIWGIGNTCNQAPPPPPPPNPTKILFPRPKPHLDSKGNPATPPPPSAPKWQYQQSTGILALKVDNTVVQPVKGGYAGHGQGLNDPDSQSVGETEDKADAGPLPQGNYTIGPLFNNIGSTGNNSMRLAPDSANEMFGRDNFLLHGPHPNDHMDSSEGCPVLPLSTRQAVAASGVPDLQVVP